VGVSIMPRCTEKEQSISSAAVIVAFPLLYRAVLPDDLAAKLFYLQAWSLLSKLNDQNSMPTLAVSIGLRSRWRNPWPFRARWRSPLPVVAQTLVFSDTSQRNHLAAMFCVRAGYSIFVFLP